MLQTLTPPVIASILGTPEAERSAIDVAVLADWHETRLIPADPTRGHCADHGGLRGHSRGASYPWGVIVHREDDGALSGTVKHLVSGDELCGRASIAEAHRIAAALAAANA